MKTLVLGSGIVGRAAAWDLDRRGHEVTVADADPAAAQALGEELGLTWKQLDATDSPAVLSALSTVDSVISGVPYRFGAALAQAAVQTRTHYYDFGGNPAVVKEQLLLDESAAASGVAVVPDCGLAPGLANVMAAGAIADAGTATDVQIRVGVLPRNPEGTIQYQLAFYAGGLINEYAEQCEIISDGVATTVDPLTRFEGLDWDGLGRLEAFSTAGGTSTMCQEYEGLVDNLEYKTIRYPGHGRIFAAMREIGLFEVKESRFGATSIAPRTVLESLLTDRLPRGGPDITLVHVSVTTASGVSVQRIMDEHDGRFSSLARTTAFPATALCDLIARGEVEFVGAAAMHTASPGARLIAELAPVDITIENW